MENPKLPDATTALRECSHTLDSWISNFDSELRAGHFEIAAVDTFDRVLETHRRFNNLLRKVRKHIRREATKRELRGKGATR